MMTVGEHIKQLFSGFKISLNDAALNEVASMGEINLDDEYTSSNHDKIIVAVLRFAPMMLLTPTSYSVSENGHSKSMGFNSDGFVKWYSLMCKRYGLPNELDIDKPKITFL